MRTALAVGVRLGGLVIVFLGVTLAIYLLVFALPGDPIRALGGDRPLPESTVATLRARYHLDEPVLLQYLRWLGGVLHGDLGIDFDGRPVAERLLGRWPITVQLALSAWALEIAVGVGLGLIAAVRAGRPVDRVILVTTVVVGAVPVFVVGSVLQLVFGVRLHWFPVAGSTAGWPSAFVLPALAIAVFGFAAVSRLTRASALDALGSDSVRLVRAKGVGEARVVGVHVLRNSLIPVSTYLATDLGLLLGGTVVVEGIFNLPGVGNLLFTAIRGHEGPTIVGVSTLLIVVFLVTSTLVDLLHIAIDPRLRRG